MSDVATNSVVASGTAPPSTCEQWLALPWPVRAVLSADGGTLHLTTTSVRRDTDGELVEVSAEQAWDLGTARPAASPDVAGRVLAWSPSGDRALTIGPAGLAVEHGRPRSDDGGSGDGGSGAGAERGRVPVVLAPTDAFAGGVAWSPDGCSVVVSLRRGVAADRSRPFRWTRPLFAADGVGPLDDPPQLCRFDLPAEPTSGTDVQAVWLTDDCWRWSSPVWSPSGTSIAAIASIDPTSATSGQRLRTIEPIGSAPSSADSGAPSIVVDAPVPAGRTVVAVWLPDGRLVAVVAEPRGRPSGSTAELHVVDASGGHPVEVEGLDGELFGDVYGDHPGELADAYDGTLLALPDGSLLARAVRGGRTSVVRLRWTGPSRVSASVVVDGERCITPVAVTVVDGRHVLVVAEQSSTATPSLTVVDLADGRARPLVPAARPTGPAGTVLHRSRFYLALPDGFVLEAWYLARPDLSGPLPTVVLVHGGPHYAYGEAFSLDAHSLAAAGFGVLFTNPRGSTGYGDAFAHAVHGDWAFGPSADVLAVVDRAVELGLADGTRLGIAGNSYGGYLSAWLASTTDRFRAAVIENPVTDLTAMWATSDIGQHFFPAQFGGAPHEVPDVYREQSPLLRAHHCRTPSLFVVGELDRRCPPAQAWGMHRVLSAIGTPSEVLVLPGSPHEGSTYGPPLGRVAHDEALVEWMRRWLGDPSASPQAPAPER